MLNFRQFDKTAKHLALWPWIHKKHKVWDGMMMMRITRNDSSISMRAVRNYTIVCKKVALLINTQWNWQKKNSPTWNFDEVIFCGTFSIRKLVEPAKQNLFKADFYIFNDHGFLLAIANLWKKIWKNPDYFNPCVVFQGGKIWLTFWYSVECEFDWQWMSMHCWSSKPFFRTHQQL